MNRLLIRGAKIVCGKRIEDAALLCENGIIADADFHGEPPEDCEVEKVSGYLLPPFIEIHAHGGGGCDFIDNSRKAFDTIVRTHLSHGVALICPTLTACPIDKLLAFLDLCEEYYGKPYFAGVHLEGPFLAPEMCGAQNKRWIIKPDERIISELSERLHLISRITAAPEIEGIEELAKTMTKYGVGMSIGHSVADADMVRRAFDWGFQQITHLYCSTSRSSKRGGRVVGGIEETALTNESCYVELIADGHHVSRESFLLTLKCKSEKVCAVSDAMRAAGNTVSGDSYLGEMLPENRVIIEDGVAKLPDRSSFAGSLALGDTMVSALCGDYGLPLATVSEMMSAAPAGLLGLRKKGRLLPGYDADFVLLDHEYRTKAVYMAGSRVYVNHERMNNHV